MKAVPIHLTPEAPTDRESRASIRHLPSHDNSDSKAENTGSGGASKLLVGQGISRDHIPPEVAKIPELYKEAVFHQVRAVRDFDLRTYGFKKVQKVHLMLAADSSLVECENLIALKQNKCGR